MALSREDVVDAFRMILGRPPANDAGIAYHMQTFPELKDLRSHLIASMEFRDQFWDRMAEMQPDHIARHRDFAVERMAFLHIPKTAGFTLSSLLDKQFAKDEIFPNPVRIDHYPASQLTKYKFFRGHYGLSDIQYIPDPKCVFTIIREPRARILSQYHFYKAHKQAKPTGATAATPEDPMIAKARQPVKRYLKDPEVRAHISIDNMQTRLLFCLTPRAVKKFGIDLATVGDPFATLPRRTILDIAKDNLKQLDYVGIVDEFDAFMEMFLSQQGLPVPAEYEKLNVTRDLGKARPGVYKKVNIEEPDEETQHLLDQLVELDEELYRFAGNLFEKQLMNHKLAKRPARLAGE